MNDVDDDTVAAVITNPDFIRLTTTRARLRWSLALATAVVFFGFILLISFARGWLAERVGGGVMPVGFYLAIATGAFVVLVTGLYVFVANTRFGPLTRRLVREVAP